MLAQAPVAASQESVVQTLLSLQFLSVPLQVPAEQASFVVQRLLSLHAIVLLVYLHAPVDAVQVSVVQILLSLQTLAVPPQVPLAHLSPKVQALPSLHVVPFATGVWIHAPVAGSQVSVVQVLLSLQRVAASAHRSATTAVPRMMVENLTPVKLPLGTTWL